MQCNSSSDLLAPRLDHERRQPLPETFENAHPNPIASQRYAKKTKSLNYAKTTHYPALRQSL